MLVRIDDSFAEPQLASSLLEYDEERLRRLRNKGRVSFGQCEGKVRDLLA
jgi:hypothetical protein